MAGNSRADDEARTRDLNLGKVALYQLSYVRLFPPVARQNELNHTQTLNSLQFGVWRAWRVGAPPLRSSWTTSRDTIRDTNLRQLGRWTGSSGFNGPTPDAWSGPMRSGPALS